MKDKNSNSLFETRKNQILDAAGLVFAKEGFNNASTDKIASLANLGKGTIYRYFKNKKSLFFSVVDRGLDGLKESMLKEVSQIADPLDRVEAAIKTYLTFFDRNPSFVDILIHEHSSFSNRIEKKYFEHYYGNVEKIRNTFKMCMQKGLIKSMDIDVAIKVLTNILHGMIYTWHIDGKRYKLVDRVPTICKIFFTGIVKDQHRRKKYE